MLTTVSVFPSFGTALVIITVLSCFDACSSSSTAPSRRYCSSETLFEVPETRRACRSGPSDNAATRVAGGRDTRRSGGGVSIGGDGRGSSRDGQLGASCGYWPSAEAFGESGLRVSAGDAPLADSHRRSAWSIRLIR